MAKKRPQANLPSILDEGFRDPAGFPIAPVLKHALSQARQEFNPAVCLLRGMWNCDREEAGVFLIGLLLTCGDNWEKRRIVASALCDVQTEACIRVLFDEVRRVKSRNETRRYLREVIGVLSCMPTKLVHRGFEELAGARCLAPQIQAKVEAALDDVTYRQQHGY